MLKEELLNARIFFRLEFLGCHFILELSKYEGTETKIDDYEDSSPFLMLRTHWMIFFSLVRSPE